MESGVKYIRRNFICGLLGREPHSLEDTSAELRWWVWEVANQRVHGTTHCVVQQRWREEKLPICSLWPDACPIPSSKKSCDGVSRDAYVAWQGNRYSVPWSYARPTGARRGHSEVVEVYADDERIANHALLAGKHRIAARAEHHAGTPLGSLRPTGRAQARIRLLGPQVEVRSLAVYDCVAAGGAR